MESIFAVLMFVRRYLIKPGRLINEISRCWYHLNAKYRMSKLFPEFFAPNTKLTLVLPSICLKPSSEECHIVAYKDKDFGDIPGQVNTSKPFIRHTDALAAGTLRNVFSTWFPHLSEKLDDEMTTEDCQGNIICIGGQTNWIFRQYLYEEHKTQPLEYHLIKGQKDWFEDKSKNTVWSSDDKEYGYGLICSIRNNENSRCRVLFVSGLSYTGTIATAKRLSNDILNIYKQVKNDKLLRSGFYLIVRFKRTTTPAQPLAFHNYIIGRVSP